MISQIRVPFQQVDVNTLFESIGNELACLGAANASGAWPTANKAFYIPFMVHEPTIVDRMFCFNGTAGIPNDNADLGIYDHKTLAKLGSTGSFAVTGTSTMQVVALTADVFLPRGAYYMAMANSSTNTTNFRFTVQASALYQYLTGCREEASAMTLPVTATPVVPVGVYIPYIGIIPKGIPS